MAKSSTDKVYVAKQIVKKMTIALNNKNMQIIILKTNRKGTTNLLNKLPYLSDRRNLKSRYVHVVINYLRQYGS